MTDDTGPLRPVSDEEVQHDLAFALRYRGRKRVHEAEDVMARITAERLTEHLRRCGYVLAKKPDATAPTSSGHGRKPEP